MEKGIEEKMAKVKSVVAELTTSPESLVVYQEIDLHMIFDINLEKKFRRKARLVMGRYNKKAPSLITYSLVLLQGPVHICLLIAVLNGLDIQYYSYLLKEDMEKSLSQDLTR